MKNFQIHLQLSFFFEKTFISLSTFQNDSTEMLLKQEIALSSLSKPHIVFAQWCSHPGIIRWASQRTAGPLTGLKEFGAFPRSWGKKYLLFTAIWPFRLKKLSQEALETMVEFLLSSPALPQVESGPGSATSPELLRKKKKPKQNSHRNN